MPNVEIEVGLKFFNLEVLRLITKSGNGESWECLCVCGNKKRIWKHQILGGMIKSCGCLKNSRLLKHGKYGTPLYKIFSSMKIRCYNHNNKDYKYYGLKGVIIYKEWMEDFNSFESWCLKNGWEKGLQIDRINANGNYEPLNCRITTLRQNIRNKDGIMKIFDNNGNSLFVSDVSKEYGVKLSTLYLRIGKGLTFDQCVSKNKLIINGKM